MGNSTSINIFNSIGHLIEGNVYTFLQQTIYSDEMLRANMEFLYKFIIKPSELINVSEYNSTDLHKELEYLRSNWLEIRQKLQAVRNIWIHLPIRFENVNKKVIMHMFQDEGLLNYFFYFSRLLSRCKIKSILLPGFDSNNPLNLLLTREIILKKLVHIYPDELPLILQCEEMFNKEDIAILNVFPKFDKALLQIDNWPGVFLWNKIDSLFIPIKEEEELYEIFNIIRYEENSFDYLREQFAKMEKSKNYAYIFHLSDLHFGNKLAEKRTMRIIRILEEQVSKLEENALMIPIITGDLMQSPSDTNKHTYLQFSELLLSKGFETPIHVLGNHDVDLGGILKLLSKQKSIIASLSKNTKIEIIEDLKLAIIKFDSNTGGELAQGKIGEDQLMEIGNQIDAMKNKDSYTFIAVLHHHPLEIENPDWYKRDWYESILGSRNFEKTMKLVDSDLFLEWIKRRGIKYILHGHKHIPKIHGHEDITIIAAGSSSGSVKHLVAGKTYLTYNLIKYDVDNRAPISCSIIAEEIIGAGTKNMLLHMM